MKVYKPDNNVYSRLRVLMQREGYTGFDHGNYCTLQYYFLNGVAMLMGNRKEAWVLFAKTINFSDAETIPWI